MLCFAVFPPCSWLRRLLTAAAASRRIPLLSFSLSSCPPPVCLYLDAKTNSYVEEFSTSNFIGVTKDGVVVTPTSDSILPSCTKGVVLQAARDLGSRSSSVPSPSPRLPTSPRSLRAAPPSC